MSHRLGMYEYFNTCKSDTNPHYKRRILGESGDQSVLDVEALANDISGPFQINEVPPLLHRSPVVLPFLTKLVWSVGYLKRTFERMASQATALVV